MLEDLHYPKGSAHTLFSFEFEDGRFIAVSAEIRKEKGERFNPINGLLNGYELQFVIAREADVIKLRSNYRKDKVYLYPLKLYKEQVKKLFILALQRTDKLSKEPEFYNTVTNNCTTNLIDLLNKVLDKKIPKITLSAVLPLNADKMFFKLNLIDTELPLLEAREKFFINDKAGRVLAGEDFYKKIRLNIAAYYLI
jgi:hypothetical protein